MKDGRWSPAPLTLPSTTDDYKALVRLSLWLSIRLHIFSFAIEPFCLSIRDVVDVELFLFSRAVPSGDRTRKYERTKSGHGF